MMKIFLSIVITILMAFLGISLSLISLYATKDGEQYFCASSLYFLGSVIILFGLFIFLKDPKNAL